MSTRIKSAALFPATTTALYEKLCIFMNNYEEWLIPLVSSSLQTQISASSDGTDLEVIRGCSESPVCYNVSYSVGNRAHIVSCCQDEQCNGWLTVQLCSHVELHEQLYVCCTSAFVAVDLREDVFECMQCVDEDGVNSTCPRNNFWGSERSSLATTLCTKYCKVKATTDRYV